MNLERFKEIYGNKDYLGEEIVKVCDKCLSDFHQLCIEYDCQCCFAYK